MFNITFYRTSKVILRFSETQKYSICWHILAIFSFVKHRMTLHSLYCSTRDIIRKSNSSWSLDVVPFKINAGKPMIWTSGYININYIDTWECKFKDSRIFLQLLFISYKHNILSEWDVTISFNFPFILNKRINFMHKYCVAQKEIKYYDRHFVIWHSFEATEE